MGLGGRTGLGDVVVVVGLVGIMKRTRGTRRTTAMRPQQIGRTFHPYGTATSSTT
jgi:hypothetical protein